MAARDNEAGSFSAVSPGTSTWATMTAGTPAAMAAPKGTRSFVRSSSMGATGASWTWGSADPPPIPGQCFTTEIRPADCCASMMAVAKPDTAAGSSPNDRVPSPEPLPTSATGPKFMLKPRSRMAVAYGSKSVAASCGVSSAMVSADGSSSIAAPRRCTVPPSSSLATNGAMGASVIAAVTSSPTSEDWRPFSANPPARPAESTAVASCGPVTITMIS